METDFVSEYVAIKSHLIALKRFQGQMQEDPPPDALALATIVLVCLLMFLISVI